MTRVVVAPCSPFSVTTELMRDSADLARNHGVRLHTHLAETVDEERFCVEKFGRRPMELMQDLGWTGADVWYAHGIHLNDAEVDQVAETKTGIAHCPSSNMRLGAGICRVEDLLRAGAKVGLGVDGSASNEDANLAMESHQALLLARVRAQSPRALDARRRPGPCRHQRPSGGSGPRSPGPRRDRRRQRTGGSTRREAADRGRRAGRPRHRGDERAPGYRWLIADPAGRLELRPLTVTWTDPSAATMTWKAELWSSPASRAPVVVSTKVTLACPAIVAV